MPDSQRIDRWLWFARFFKSRTLAAKACDGRRVRVNRQVIAKSSATLKVGDVLTFPQARRIRVIKVLDLGQRRGPAAEAQTLYEDLDPPAPKATAAEATPAPSGTPPAREPGSGRPTKRDRRALDALKLPDEQAALLQGGGSRTEDCGTTPCTGASRKKNCLKSIYYDNSKNVEMMHRQDTKAPSF